MTPTSNTIDPECRHSVRPPPPPPILDFQPVISLSGKKVLAAAILRPMSIYTPVQLLPLSCLAHTTTDWVSVPGGIDTSTLEVVSKNQLDRCSLYPEWSVSTTTDVVHPIDS